MKYLTVDEIKVYTPGKLIKKIITERNMTIDEFCKSKNGRYWISPCTVKQYLRNNGTKKFRWIAANRLNISIAELEKTPQEQIKNYVEEILKNKSYYRTQLNILNKIKELCFQYNMTVEAAKITREIGIYYYKKGELEKSLSYIEIAIDMMKGLENQDQEEFFDYVLDKAIIYYRMSDLDESLKTYRALENSKKYVKSDRILYKYYYNYSIVLMDRGMIDKSIDKLNKAIHYTENNHYKIAQIYNNLGICYDMLNNFELSIEHYKKALFYHSPEKHHIVYNNLAMLYNKLNMQNDALGFATKTLNAVDEQDEKYLNYYQTYFEILINMGKIDECFNRIIKKINILKHIKTNNNRILSFLNWVVVMLEKYNNYVVCKQVEKIIYDLISGCKNNESEYCKKLFEFLGRLYYIYQ